MCNRFYEKWSNNGWAEKVLMKKIYITPLVFFYKKSVATRVYFINLFADPSPCVRDPNDPANYTCQTLSDDQKLELLTVKVSFPHLFKFPTTAGRCFRLSRMEKRPRLRYSIRNDTAHCICCICFSNNTGPNESPFISKGFKNQKKAGDERQPLTPIRAGKKTKF